MKIADSPSHKAALGVLAVASLLMSLLSPTPAAAATVTPPDMQILVPANLISIGTLAGVRSLEFTHRTADLGTGPFELDPTYNAATGIATFVQKIYNSPSPGVWSADHTVPVAATGVWNTQTASDYNWPLTAFTLNQINTDGSLGAQVARSPKTDYCMTGDTFVGGVPNTPGSTFIPASNCTDPNAPLGWSVGWADSYDLTDPGQPVPLTGVPDGTYVLRAIVDPQHVLTESDPTNNVLDTTLTISGSNVTVLSQTQPTSGLPVVAITSPTQGATVSGTVTVTATASAVAPVTISSVQFSLDGQPLGPADTAAPYAVPWVVGQAAPGSHLLGAVATDSGGQLGNALGVSVTVPVQSGGLAIERTVASTGRTSASVTNFSTSTAGEQLIAMVGSDGPNGAGQQTVTVAGGGLSWSLVRRTNSQPGDSEIWKATAATVLSGATLSSTASATGYNQQLTVVALRGAGGTGAIAGAGAATGAAAVSYTATVAGSLGLAVGNDYDQAVNRTLGTGQVLLSQYVDPSQDTYWAQSTSASPTVGQAVALTTTAPTGDHWNMTGVEVVPSGVTTPDSTPPTVSLTNPLANTDLSGTVPVAATASDNVAVASVQFLLDGLPLGSPATTVPYAISWNTTTTTSGAHSVAARATDTSGNAATSTATAITVTNPAPPPPACFIMDVRVSAHGTSTVTTPAFHTGLADEVLMAFVASDGPRTASSQTATVTGAGLTWTRVNRSNQQFGDAEMWTATTTAILTNATVSSTPGRAGYDQDLTVIAVQGSHGTRANAIASAATGAPSVSLTTVAPASLVFMVGNDWDRATPRTLPAGWIMLDQWVDTRSGDAFWIQFTNQPTGPAGSLVRAFDTAPTKDRWNVTAVELINDDS
jgi:hypothetical protein